MASVEHISPTKVKKKHRHEERHGKKRKRQTTPESSKEVAQKSSNGEHVGESANDAYQTPPPTTKDTNPFLDSSRSLSTGKKRINPFSILASQYEDISHATSPTTPSTPPHKPPSLPSSAKKVVQFNEDDSDDDDDLEYIPSKRKKHGKFHSPRTPQSPKFSLTSPKKVSRKDHLEARVKELEYERRKLPIWTGICLRRIEIDLSARAIIEND